MAYQFEDRVEAGQRLADALYEYRGREDVILLAIPRGGVPVASEVAKVLSLPLDVLLVAKLGVPGNEDLTLGVVVWDHLCYINQNIVDRLDIPEAAIKRIIEKKEDELMRFNMIYRNDRRRPAVRNKTVIVIDEGMATGATMHAAAAALNQAEAARIVAAVPVAAGEVCSGLEADVDEVVCVYTPEIFYNIGQWYNDFSEVSDVDVQRILQNSSMEAASYRRVQRL